MRRFALKLAGFTVILLALDFFVIGSDLVIGWLFKYRPRYGTVGTAVYVERQMVGVEHRHRQVSEPHVIFIGSSSVVNGIDTAEIERGWRGFGIETKALNYGLTTLSAYELPFLKDYLFTKNTALIVYLYNSNAFLNELHPQAFHIRWNTLEFLRLATFWELLKNAKRVARGLAGEWLYSLRYQGLARELILRAASGDLVAEYSDLDFPKDEPMTGNRSRSPMVPLPESDFNRRTFLSSDTDEENLSYRGLARFMELSRLAGVPVFYGPAPEPHFADFGRWRQGVNVDRVDKHVERICARQARGHYARSEIDSLQSRDELFRDDVHLSEEGRRIFSRWIAQRLTPFLATAPRQISSE